MENTKKTKKIAIGLICLSVLVIIGLTIYQHRQLKKLSQDVEMGTAVSNESTGGALSGPGEAVKKSPTANLAGKEPDRDEIDALEYQLGAAEEELDAANKQLSDETAKKAENAKNMIELQKKMLQDPANQKTLRNTYKGVLDTLYGSLYKELNLTQEKQDEFKELLLDQWMSSMEISLDTLGVAATEENRNDLQKRAENLKMENDAKVSALLGSQDFKTYESYRDTLSERQVVSGFAESLGEGDKLTDAQLETLIDSMYKERKNVYSQQGWDEERVTFLSEVNDEGIAKMMDMNDRTYDGYIKGAGATLTASQQEQFKAYLKNQRDMTESTLKMSAQMLGGQTTQKDDNKESK